MILTFKSVDFEESRLPSLLWVCLTGQWKVLVEDGPPWPVD